MSRAASGAERCAILSRVTPETRARLEAAARASGRSLSQEIEYRIQRSFDDEARLDDLRRVLREGRRVLPIEVLGDQAEVVIAPFSGSPQ